MSWKLEKTKRIDIDILYLVKMKGHLSSFNNYIARKPSCAEPIVIPAM